ncbi:MAG: putative NRPS-like protein biosynthetic cluster [Bathelium mastoideum]|nr:MAG: putative NRPS-like protein biosynthetic cluster [Bathelium mastoideum]
MLRRLWRTRACQALSLQAYVARSASSLACTKGPLEPPLLEETIGQHFASIVSKHGDRLAVVSSAQRSRLTYDALDTASNALARGLKAQGVRKGDRVAVSLGNNIEFATATYALFKLGAILVPLNPGFNAGQVVSALNHLSSSYLVIGSETNLPFKRPRSNIPLLTHLVPNLRGNRLESELVLSLRKVVIVNNSSGRIDCSELKATTSYEHVLEAGGSGRPLEDQHLHQDEVVNIQFTSGTTSMPKAACLSHRSILNNGKSIGDRMLLTPADIVCCPPPLFHCFGSVLGYMATATHGASIVFPAEAFDPAATLRAVRDERSTALYGVPTMFVAELELISSSSPSSSSSTSASASASASTSSSSSKSTSETFHPADFRTLRTGIAAGSSVPAELMRKLHRALNLTELTICYGMTETSPVSAMTTTRDPMERRVDSVGRCLPHIEAKVVDVRDRERVLARGERGELVVSGYSVMKGYWGDEAKTLEVRVVDAEGKVWMHTGDEASMDEEGYIRITGRIKDLIIRGGENIHPLEIENCLFAHPAIAEASVVGLPDDRYGEIVAAFVVRHSDSREETLLGAAEVRDWVKQRLSSHLVPKYVFWIDSTAFPKTASGKIQKFKLREIGQELQKKGLGLD